MSTSSFNFTYTERSWHISVSYCAKAFFLSNIFLLVFRHYYSKVFKNCVHNRCDKRFIIILTLDPVPGIESLSGSSYMLFTAPETWNNASDSCKCLGAQLVKIESAAENNFLKRTFLTSSGLSFWIGLNDQIDEGKWKWTDGTPLEIYNNWSNGNPNNYGGNQNCGHITMGNISVGGYTLKNFDGKWNDLNCNFALGYICEKIYP